MDPISTLSVAASVTSLLNRSMKVVSKTYAFSQQGKGEFSDAIAELRRGEAILQQVSLILSEDTLSESGVLLLRLTTQYVSLAEEASKILENVGALPGLGTWKSFRQGIKSSIYKDKIADLERRMARMRDELHFVLLSVLSRRERVTSTSVTERQNLETSADQMRQRFQAAGVPVPERLSLHDMQKLQTDDTMKAKSLKPPDHEILQLSDINVEIAARTLVQGLLDDNRLRRTLLSAIARMGKISFRATLARFFYEFSTLPFAEKSTSWIMIHQPAVLANMLSDKIIPLTIENVREQPRSDFDQKSGDFERAINISDVPENVPRFRADPKAIQKDLLSSKVFSWLCESFQREVFLSPKELISDTLSQRLLDQGPNKVSCHIEWQLVQYLRQEFPNASSFAEIFTITGELDKAWGTSMSEYMSKTWPTGSGKVLCDTLQDILLHQSYDKEIAMEFTSRHHCTFTCHYSEESDIDEYADITVSGNLDEIQDTIEQFAWLAAIFRRPDPERVTVSDVNFKPGISEDAPQGSDEMQHFELSLYPVELGMDIDPSAQAQCWMHLFPESIVAYRFPIPTTIRESPLKGLAMPFDVMTSATGIKYPITYKGGILLAGGKALLVPAERHNDDVQWHLLQGEERFLSLEYMRRLMIETADDAVFQPKNSLTFLGYHRHAGVHIGTGEAALQNIKDSEVPAIGAATRVEKRVGFNIGINYHGAGLGTTGGLLFAQRESARISDAQRTPDDRIRNAKAQPIILYDDESKRAFMASELSVALQMAHSTLSRRELPIYIRNQIPFAEVSADGGEAAHAALLKASKLKIPPEFGSDSVPFWEMVCQYLVILEQRKVQDQANLTAKVTVKEELRAWEYTRIEAKWWLDTPRSPHTRLLEMMRPMWWKFSEDSEILVLVGRGFECPIRPRHNDQPICNAWPEVPQDRDLLATTVPVLWQARKLLRKTKEQRQGRMMLSDSIAWARPIHSRLFRPCNNGANNKCRPIQGLRNVEALGGESGYQRHPGQVELDEGVEGAVIFGNGNDALKFEYRDCVIVQPPPAAPLNEPEGQNDFYHPLYFAFFALLAGVGMVGNVFLRDSVTFSQLGTHDALRRSTQMHSIADNKVHDML